MTHIDLFSGIGGFALACKWAGIETVQFVEIDPFCQKVLKKNFPGVPIHDDIKTFKYTGATPFILTGGFPCQDISYAGKGAGIKGERSGLWYELARVIGEVVPRFVIVENVSAILHRGMSEVLGTLASIGYDAEWHCIPASYFNAPHSRDRAWIIAYPSRNDGTERDMLQKGREWETQTQLRGLYSSLGGGKKGEWDKEPSSKFLRVDDGLPAAMDRLKALGNAIVPQVAFQIIKAIVEIEGDNNTDNYKPSAK